MTEPRIAILNGRDQVLSFLDNSQPDSIHYYDDILHRYLAGSASTFEFKVMSYQDPKEFLQVGNKLSFHHPEMGDFYFNIVTVERGEDETFVSAVGLTFELLNEEVSETNPSAAKSFVQYLDDWGFERERLKIGINEVSDKKIKNEWSGTETILKRLFSLANVFDAELEFVPVLNSDYSLSHLVMNVYRADHGMGQDKRDKTLRYSDGIDGITKTSDISDLITAIRPAGRDGLSLVGLSKPKEEDGCYLSGGDIRSETARDRFPSQVVDTGDGYIMGFWSCDVDSKEMLYGRALAELRKKSVPKISYDVSGYVEANIGDRVTIEDEQFIPKLFVQCRVVEQEISFTDPSKSKRIFDNFTEIRSEISSDITAQMEQLIEKYKQYQCSISASNGITFVNGTGQTVLTAIVRDGVADRTDDFEIRWIKDGSSLSTGKTITIKSADFGKSSQYGFEIWKDGLNHGQAEVTLTNLKDGADGKAGKDGSNGTNGKTSYFHVKYSSVSNPTTASQMTETPSTFIGTYTDFTQADSTDPRKYTWMRFQGLKGDQGIPGTNGTNGKTSYLHIAYATNATGTSGFSVSDSAGKTYIGQYTDFVQNDSTNPSKYSWTLIKGEKGDQGLRGADGKNGINGTNGKDGKDGLNGLNGIDALSIEISQSWSGDEVTLTASVFRGGTKLTDDQILALGQIRWFKGGTRLGNGKSIKRTLTGRETIECRLDNGASVSKLALLDNGELVSTNRNLLKNADFANRGTDSRYNPDFNPGQTFASGWGGYNAGAEYPDEYHAHLVEFEGEWVYDFHESRDGSQWLGISMPIYSISDQQTPSPLLPNTKMTISCEIYRVSGKNIPTCGIYHRIKGNPNTAFHSGGTGTFKGEIKTGEWVRVSRTIAIHSDFDPEYAARLYLYGDGVYADGGANGEFYLKHPMLTYGDTVEPFTTRIEDQNGTDKTVTLAYKSLTIEMDLQPIITEGLTNAQGERVELENRLLKQVEESVGSVSQTIKDEVYAKSDVDRMLSSVSTTLKQDKESVQILFNQLSAQMSESGQATDAQFDEISKYIRFIDGNIELGNSSSPIQLKIMNDKISFQQAGEEVAWFSNNALYVTDGNFMKSLRVGKFAFVPRANGSLDFKKVGD